jgi:long-chain acyl-CoA synthetase
MAHAFTMLGKIERHAEKRPNDPALHDKKKGGGWDVTSWKEYVEATREIGKGLMSLGVDAGACVALVGANRVDWVKCQHGINAAAAIPAPLYTTLLPDQMAYIIGNAQASVAICDDDEQLDKLIAIRELDDSPLEYIVTMDDLGRDDERVMSLSALMAKASEVSDEDIDARLEAVKEEDTALLIYTSGTTGLPKGAMLTHAGIHAIGTSAIKRYPSLDHTSMRMVSYLPLCHAAEQGMTNFTCIEVGARVYFCPDMKQIKEYLNAVRPHMFLAVPRVWEKFEAVLRGKMAEATGIKAWLAGWARGTEFAGFEADVKGVSGPMLRGLANSLVISKIKNALGLDELKIAVSGAAPISRSTLEFFASIGVAIHEGYGMTETTAFASSQPEGKPRFGTIGQPLACTEVKIAEDGEIMLRGVNMVKGYLRLPDKTAELYDDDDGWMHTGDLGELDADNYIKITGRKKDIIITAGGKNVAPAEMEGYIQGIAGVGQAVVVGDRQPYLCALVVLDPEALPALEAASGISGLDDVAAASKNDEVKKFLLGEVEARCNDRVARYQTIKKIEVLDNVFSVDTGELTPTLKVKRNVVNDKYAGHIAAFYDKPKKRAAEAQA